MAALRSVLHVAKLTSYQYTRVLQHGLARNFHPSSFINSSKLYSKEHEWVLADGDIGTIGISEYAREKLGDIVYIQLPEVDTEVEREDECGAIESVKAASDIYTPVGGVIVEVNAEVEANCEIINQSPEKDGWLFKVRMNNFEEDAKELMDKDAYDAFIKEES